MSLPQFKELVAFRIEEQINQTAAYLITQRSADLDKLRSYQGEIAGLRIALDIIAEQYKKMYG